MQSFKVISIFTDSLGKIGIGLIVILGIYLSMSILDVEDSNDNSIPLINLSFCSIGFALLSLLFVYPPLWLGANSLSWFWISGFAVAWAFGSASMGVLRLLPYLLIYYTLLQSQYSTDTRTVWIKMLSEPESLAIMVISLLTGLLLLFGSLCGLKLLESHSQPYAFFLLIFSALLGLCLGETLHLAVQMLSVSFA
ncbi:MAG: hypothetical protein F6J95_000545 [Leptolyngbya sp. SIO1E4]|nr:hypothetical protein [Leptolyngbya sp. SIO1E4]